MKRFCIALLSLCAASCLHAAVVMTEDFNYTAGSALLGQGSGNVWTLSTKADNAIGATPDFCVSATGLTMADYGDGLSAPGLGLSFPQAALDNTSKQRVLYKHFDTGNAYKSGSLYATFLIKVSTPSNNARDFFSFEGATGTTQRARLFTKKNGTGFQIGVTRANTTPIYSELLELDKTYLVVLKYEFIDGSLNDEATLFVGFPLGYSEESAAVQAKAYKNTDFDAATADPSQLKGVAVKLRDGGSAMQIAHLRVATTWQEAVNYTGEPVEPEDTNKPVAHFQEGFDTNGNWTITGAGASTAKNHGEYGTTSRSISFNKTESTDRCNNARMISPAVNSAGVLRFWLTGSANETRGNILVSKIIGSDTTDVQYIEGPFGKTWTEHTVIINDETSAIKIMLTVNGCGLGAGTLYIDDVSLTNYVAGNRPGIDNITLTQPFPSASNPTQVTASITAGEETRTIAEVRLLWGLDTSTDGGQLVMTKSGGLYRSEALPITPVGQTIYYRIVAFDNYYISDTSDVQSVTTYQDYSVCLPQRTLAAGESLSITEGLEGLRVDFGIVDENSSLRVIDAQAQSSDYIGTGRLTTGDLHLIAEPGEIVTLTNSGNSPLTITAIRYNTFRPVVFTACPRHLQLYPRTADGSAEVSISGYSQSSITQMTFTKKRDGELQEQHTIEVTKGKPFSTTFSIVAEPAEYSFEYAIGEGETQLLADSVVAGDVYLIAGQSNGAASGSGNPGVTNQFWRNFGCVQKTQAYNPADTLWGLSNSAGWGYGKPFYNGWSGYIIQRNLLREQNMPTAVLNVAIGGSSLNQNLPDPDNHENLNTFYGEGLYRMRKAGLAEAVKAIIWVQGESDQNGLYEDYALRFDRLYQAWKQDYPNIEHIYLSQINVGCGVSMYASEMRETQRLFGQIYDDVTVITNIGITIRYDSCHYVDDGYDRLYTQYSRLIERDIYGKSFDTPVTSPAVQCVRWADANKTAIQILFDQQMVWPGIIWGRDMKDYFYDQDEQPIPMLSGRVDEADRRTVVLELDPTATRPTHLTYGPDSYVYSATRGMDTLYVDPWLRNDEGYAALTFNRYPIADHSVTAYEVVKDKAICRIEEEVLIVDSKADIDSIAVYTALGQLALLSTGHRCSLQSLPTGIYGISIRLKNGEAVSTKIRK